MRVRITFNVKNRGGIVPFHHQYLIAQIFKGLLIAEGNEKFKDYTFFSFSGLKGQTKVSRSGLQYTSRKTTIVISSVNDEFIDHLVSLILEQEMIQVGNLQIVPEVADQETDIDLGIEPKYVCISPIVLISPSFNSEDGARYIDPTSDEFSDLLYTSTVNRMSEFGIDVAQIPDIQKFQIIPDEAYLTKMEDMGKKISRVYPVYDQDVKYEARGYTFPFKLYAANEVQQFIFTCGLGEYAYKGFGMLDFANSNPAERTVVYKTKEQLITTG